MLLEQFLGLEEHLRHHDLCWGSHHDLAGSFLHGLEHIHCLHMRLPLVYVARHRWPLLKLGVGWQQRQLGILRHWRTRQMHSSNEGLAISMQKKDAFSYLASVDIKVDHVPERS